MSGRLLPPAGGPPGGSPPRPPRALPRPPAGPLNNAGEPVDRYAHEPAGGGGGGLQEAIGVAEGAATGAHSGGRPPVDPRFRRRWAEARRAEGRRRLRVLVAAASVVALVGGAFGLLHSPLFEVRHVEVIGNAHIPAAKIEKAAGLTGGPLMISAGSARATRAVEELPWVASVSFERRWPWTLIIKVTERRAVALVVAGSRLDLVDANGRSLETLPAGEQAPALPVVSGAGQAQPGRLVAPLAPTTRAGLSLLLKAASVTPRSVAARHVVLSWSPSAGVEARLGGSSGTVLLGGGSELAYKMAVLAELAQRVRLSGYSLIDLTVPERPALTPSTGT